MKAVGTWEGNFRSVLEDGRGHRVTVDLPPEEDGGNAGTSALELSVLSLAGCILTIFALVARRRRLTFEKMTVDIEAERPPRSPTITSVNGTLHVVTREPAENVVTALNITLKTCPVGVLFDQARIPVHVRPVVVPPATPVAGAGGQIA